MFNRCLMPGGWTEACVAWLHERGADGRPRIGLYIFLLYHPVKSMENQEMGDSPYTYMFDLPDGTDSTGYYFL